MEYREVEDQHDRHEGAKGDPVPHLNLADGGGGGGGLSENVQWSEAGGYGTLRRATEEGVTVSAES